jgi:hypothetical protein
MAPAAGQGASPDSRAKLIATLERLMTTGEPHQTSIDDGQLLQLAVDAAIRSGDTELERLAVRAAAPLFAAVTGPLIQVGQPISLGIGSRQVLNVPKPVPFEAHIYVSVDGHDYTEAGALSSDKGSNVRANLPEHALVSGVHHVRVRAQMTFGGGQLPRWSESRQLPDVTYAVYDPREPSVGVARLLLAPAAISAAELDRNLPNQSIANWLAGVLERAEAKAPVDWLIHYCVERTRRIVSPPAGGGDICAVAYFQVKGDVFRAWFRTGSLRITEEGPVLSVDPPSFEGINTSQSGTALTTLSALPALLDTPREFWPIADLEISPTDIYVETPRSDWAIITVTVRNRSRVAVHGAKVIVDVGSDPASRNTPRIVAVDVPGHGSTEVTVEMGLEASYGFVVVQAIQISDLSPHDTWTFDPSPLDACAFRLFNANLAPSGHVRAVRSSSGCWGW